MSIRKKPDLTNDEAYIINTFKQLRRYNKNERKGVLRAWSGQGR